MIGSFVKYVCARAIEPVYVSNKFDTRARPIHVCMNDEKFNEKNNKKSKIHKIL